jgi:hypothetical protein
MEDRGGVSCLRVEGEGQGGAVRVRYWFDPARSAVTRLEMQAAYDTPPDTTVKESLEVELLERARGEGVPGWLGEASTRSAALTALLVSDVLPVGPQVLYALLQGADVPLQRQVLGLAWRHPLPSLPVATLETLLRSPSARVRTMATRLLRAFRRKPPGPCARGRWRTRTPSCAAPRSAGRGRRRRSPRWPGPRAACPPPRPPGTAPRTPPGPSTPCAISAWGWRYRARPSAA